MWRAVKALGDERFAARGEGAYRHAAIILMSNIDFRQSQFIVFWLQLIRQRLIDLPRKSPMTPKLACSVAGYKLLIDGQATSVTHILAIGPAAAKPGIGLALATRISPSSPSLAIRSTSIQNGDEACLSWWPDRPPLMACLLALSWRPDENALKRRR